MTTTIKKNFITIAFNQSDNSCETKEFANLQESTSYFKTFVTNEKPEYVPVCIYNLNTDTVLEVSDYYVNDEEGLNAILKSCVKAHS